MGRFWSIGLIICVLAVVKAEDTANLIQNPGMAELSPVGQPSAWKYVSDVSFREAVTTGGQDGLLIINAATPVVISQPVALTPSGHYELSWDEQGAPGQAYQMYCEWAFVENGRTQHHGVGTAVRQTHGAWRRVRMPFQAPDRKVSSYVALRVKEGGPVQVRRLVLRAVADPGMLKNARFALRGQDDAILDWTLRGDAALFEFGVGDADLALKRAGDKGGVAYQALVLSLGQMYELSYSVRSADGGQYQAYVTWSGLEQGKRFWKNSSSEPLAAPSQWRRRRVRFVIPEVAGETGVSMGLALGNVSGGQIEMRDVRLAPLSPEELEREKIHELGGVWALSGDAVYEDGSLQVCGGRSQVCRLEGVPVQPGQYYRLDYTVIGRGVAPGESGFHAFRVSADFGQTKHDGPWDDVWHQSAQAKHLSFTAPPDCRRMTLLCEVQAGGEVVFSQFRLQAMDEPVEEREWLLLQAPFYRNTLYASRPEPEIKGRVDFPPGAARARVGLYSGQMALRQAELAKPGPVAFPARELAVGNYELRVDFLSAEGEVVATSATPVVKAAPAPAEVVLGPDRQFYVNGRMFMSNSLWNILIQDFEDGFYHVARRGVTMVMVGGGGVTEKDRLDLLDRADRHGVKLIFTCHFLNSLAERDVEIFRHSLYNTFTPRVLAHPALLGYFMVDEPAWAGLPLERLLATYRIMRDFDPYHPVWINEAPRGGPETHRQYSRACDIYGIDIYPVPYPSNHSGLEDKTMTSVGKYAAICAEAGQWRQAVWMALQGFSWQSLNGKDDGGKGYPTPRELRFMVYDALLNGATGIGYWGTGHVQNAAFLNDLLDSTAEVHRLSGLFTLPAAARRRLETTSPSLQAVAFAVGKERYVIVANQSQEAGSGALALPEGAMPAMRNLDGGPEPLVEAGRLLVRDLPGGGVAVYGTADLPAPAWSLPVANPEFDRLENPFVRFLRAKAEQRHYDGQANWIWAAGEDKSLSEVVAVFEFTLAKPVKSAVLTCTADDYSKVFLNGETLAETPGWSRMSVLPVALTPGRHELRFAARNAGGPCGIIADLAIQFADGETLHLISDQSWRAIAADQKDKALAEWPAAVVISPYGGGAWKRNVILPAD